MTTRMLNPAAAGAIALLAAAVLTAGCSGSSGSAGGSGAAAPATAQPAVESGLRKASDLPSGKFTVQLGAFESEEGAMKVASLARTRFAREVNTMFDAADGLFKVMLGIFDTKEEARTFRDTIVRQYPGDYSDAWVSDLVK